MAQIFVSHSSADNPLAVRVRECLGELGYDSVFLDVSPTEGLVPGAAWRDQLFTNLDRSDALVFVGTPTANASLWCHSELALARWLRKPVLSLLFDGVDPHELVADIQGINLASADLSPDAIRPGLVALGLEQADAVGRQPVAVPRPAGVRRVLRAGVLRPRASGRPAPPAGRPTEPGPAGPRRPGPRPVR